MRASVLLLALLLVAAGLPASTGQSGDRSAHPPIKVLADGGWESCTCVSSGSGTVEDPYLIEDLHITTDNWHVQSWDGPGIHIENTQAHAIFRNITIEDTLRTEESTDNGRQVAVRAHSTSNLVFDRIDIRHGDGHVDVGFFLFDNDGLTLRQMDLRHLNDPIDHRINTGITLEEMTLPGERFSGSQDLTLRRIDSTGLLAGSIGGASLLEDLRAPTVGIGLDPGATLEARRIHAETLSLGGQPVPADQNALVRLQHLSIGQGGIALSRVNVDLNATAVAGDLDIEGTRLGVGAVDPVSHPRVTLRDTHVGGNLSVLNPSRLATDNNTVAGTYTVRALHQPIETWTVGAPDTALDGRPVHVLRDGDTLSDRETAYVAVMGAASLHNLTLLGTGATGLYVQAPTVASEVRTAGVQERPLVVTGASLDLTDARLQASRAGLTGVDAELTAHQLGIEGGWYGVNIASTRAHLSHTLVDTSRTGLLVVGQSELTTVDTHVRADDRALSTGTRTLPGGTPIDLGTVHLTRTVLDGGAVGLDTGRFFQVHGEDCTVRGGPDGSGVIYDSGVELYFTIGVRNETTLDGCTLVHRTGAEDGAVVRMAPRGLSDIKDGALTIHGSNLRGPADHVSTGAVTTAPVALEGNWWGPAGQPRLGAGISDTTEPVHLDPIDQPPNLHVQRTEQGWRLETTDDHGLVVSAGWTLPDGTDLEAQGRWPLWDTVLHQDRLGPGSHHLFASATDEEGAQTRQHVVALVPDPTGAPVVGIDGPLSFVLGATATYEARFLGSVVDLAWDLGDNGTLDSKDKTLTITPTEPGPLPLRLTATDDQGRTDTDLITIDVRNPPPGLSIQAPAEATEGASVTLRGLTPDDDVVDWSWDLHADGSVEGTGETLTFTPASAGLLLVRLEATDAHGATGAATTVLPVGPSDPALPSLQVDPEPPRAGDVARLSADPAGPWLWDVGADGSYEALDTSLSWRFSTAGRFPVQLLSSQGEPLTTALVDVLPPDTLAFTWTGQPTLGKPLPLTAQGGGWDGFRWDLDDDDRIDAHGPTATLVPQAPGPHAIQLLASSGPASSSITRTLHVPSPDHRLAVAADPARGSAPLETSLHVGLSSPLVPDGWTLDVDGDGTRDQQGTGAPPAALALQLETPGTYTANLTVTWPRETRSSTVELTVLDPAVTSPSVEVGLVAPDTLVEGEGVHLTLQAHSDTPLSSYRVCLATCQTGTLEGLDDGVELDLTLHAGPTTLAVEVTDADGNVGSHQQLIESVANQPPLLTIAAPPPAPVGSTVQVPVEATDPEGRPVRIAWQLDGAAGHGEPVLRLPAGSHPLQVTATDPSGAVATAQVTVTVQEVLRLGLDVHPSPADPTGGLQGLTAHIQPAWSTQNAVVDGSWETRWRPAAGADWVPVENGTFHGGPRSLALAGPYPPGQVEVVVTAVAAEAPPVPAAPGAAAVEARVLVVTGP